MNPDLAAFCRREHPRLVGALSLYCGDRDVAEELAQEAVLRAVDRWPKVQAMDAPGAWVQRVGVNLAHSWFRRRARRRAGAGLAVLVVLAAVALVLPRTPDHQVVIDAPAADGWPVLARYTETGDEGEVHAWEVGARSWSTWTMVRADDGLALERDGDHRWVGTAFFLDEADRETPFDLVTEALAGLWADRHLVDAVSDVEEEWLPLAAFAPEPATGEDDRPALRAAVADRLGLDADSLVAFTAETDEGAPATWVRDGGTGLALHYEDPGLLVEATDVRFWADLPDPAPRPDVPPDPDRVIGDPIQPEASVAGRWRTLPDAPVAGRQDAGAVWTGQELLVWGGVPRAAGAAYDPAAGTWRTLPEAPIDAREWHVTVWTGAEMVVWGGSAYDEPEDPDAQVRGADFIGELRADGAAYDPAADTWRVLAGSPLEARSGAAGVWTGAELVVVGGTGEGIDPGTTHDFVDGAAYDPASDTWRAIPELPDDGLREIGRDAVWTGEEMLVGGSRFAPGLAGAYDPAADAWRLVDGSPLVGAGGFVAWTGDEAVLTDAQMAGLAAYDPDADAWRELAPPPVEWLDGVSFVAVGDGLVALGGLDGEPHEPLGAWILDPAGQAWTALDEAPLADRVNPVAVWTGAELLVWSGTAQAAGHEAAAHDDGAAWRPR